MRNNGAHHCCNVSKLWAYHNRLGTSSPSLHGPLNILELVTTQQKYSIILTLVILQLVETHDPMKGFPTKELISLIASTRLFCKRVSVFST